MSRGETSLQFSRGVTVGQGLAPAVVGRCGILKRQDQGLALQNRRGWVRNPTKGHCGQRPLRNISTTPPHATHTHQCTTHAPYAPHHVRTTRTTRTTQKRQQKRALNLSALFCCFFPFGRHPPFHSGGAFPFRVYYTPASKKVTLH